MQNAQHFILLTNFNKLNLKNVTQQDATEQHKNILIHLSGEVHARNVKPFKVLKDLRMTATHITSKGQLCLEKQIDATKKGPLAQFDMRRYIHSVPVV